MANSADPWRSVGFRSQLNGKQCRSRSVGFFRSQLIWNYTVCKGKVYPGSSRTRVKLSSIDKQRLIYYPLIIWTEMLEETVQINIISSLEKQYKQGLHCFAFSQQLLESSNAI